MVVLLQVADERSPGHAVALDIDRHEETPLRGARNAARQRPRGVFSFPCFACRVQEDHEGGFAPG